MCGIAGYVTIAPNQDPESRLVRMTDSIAHRGPDDDGFYRDSHAALGHRRLSIIDVAAGHQPMTNEDGRYWIIYNGEIFNHAAVRPELEAAGHRYQTRCDTETILHAFEEFGPRCVTRFRGMFAFAIWDREQRRLYCAVDRLGIKPLYYHWNGRTFVFGSEIKAVLAHPEVSARLEEGLLPEYLGFGYTSEERTLFSGIRKLMPGHYLTLDLRADRPEPRMEQYWDAPAPPATPEQRSDEEWIAETRQRLEETVRMRLMSDVPLGMFLSGGVDSSAIAALIRRMTDGPVKTFSVGYAEERYSELSYARQVAQRIGTDHHEVSVSMDDFFDALPQLVWHEDEPITWPSSVSLYYVSKLAAEQVKVVLTGEGSDELFAGYERYRHYHFNRKWGQRYDVVPNGVQRAVRQTIATTPLLNGNLRRKLQHTFLGREGSLESLQLDNFYCAFSSGDLSHLLKLPGFTPASIYRNYRRYWDHAGDRSLLSQMLYADQKTYLVELLMKQDRMSMACSIESRVPFLDHTFVEFAARIPDRLKIHNGESKYVLKKAVEDLLPHEIIYRKKMGFPTPIRQWLRDARAERLFALMNERDGLLAQYVDLTAMNELLDQHRAGAIDATDRIWRLLNLQIWGDLFLTGKQDRWQEGLRQTTAASVP